MPYMELQPLYDQFNFKINGVDEQLASDGTPLGSRYVSAYVCPSDTHPGEASHNAKTRHGLLSVDQLKTFKMTNYQASRGPTEQYNGGSGICELTVSWNTSVGPAVQEQIPGSNPLYHLYPDSYVECTGPGIGCFKQFGGPFTRRNYHVKMKQITDGISNTIFMGEVRPSCNKHAAEGWAFSHSGNGLNSTLVPINWDSCSTGVPPARGCRFWDTWVGELGFKSAHPGGALFVLGDASVHFLPDSIDPYIYNRLGGKSDGQGAMYKKSLGAGSTGLCVLYACCAFCATPSIAFAETSASGGFLLPKSGGMYVGVDYYPEHWPQERWETDLKMKEAGFNIVRVAEFSWILFEPEEGKYEFEWLDRWLRLAEEHGIKVIVGTPTAIMPAWLARKYPEALELKANGQRTVWGGRRHNCYSDKDYRRLADGVVLAIARHYGSHPAVVGWQIDNEIANADCRCDKCRAGFQRWLKEKYRDLAELNRAWGTHFWGQRIGDWAEIPIPDDRIGDWAISNPSACLDWQRFMSYKQVEFLDAQVKIVRAECPASQFITHNFMGLHDSLNYYDLAKNLDFVSWDNYPKLSPAIPYGSSLAADVMRGLKKRNFLIMEQTAGPLGWATFSRNPQPGELRKICYQQMAHGADGQVWFRWRTCTVGREQYWHGLLGHDGKGTYRYQEAAQVAREYQRLAPSLAGTTPRPDVGMIYDYDSAWALKFQPGYPGASHAAAVERYYDALFRAGVNVDILRPGDDIRNYKLVLAPHLHVLPDTVAKQLVDYVRDGGVLLVDCRTAVKDATNLAYDRTLPGLLTPALGIEITEYETLGLGIADKEETTYKVHGDPQLGDAFTAVHYADWIKPIGAKTIARYGPPHINQFAAVTRNEFGRGTGWYVGTIVSETQFYDRLVARLLNDARIEPLVAPPPGVEAATRANAEQKLLFLINHTEEDKPVRIPKSRRELLTDETTGESLKLKPFGVAVIELPAQ
jgi:beta-galactosidase